MARLPDEALVVRGGKNLADNFKQGTGVSLDADGKLQGVSVNAGADMTLEQLTAGNDQGYRGIPNSQLGQTTVGEVRKLGGDVEPKPSRWNPNHATLGGLTPEQASSLFTPTVKNPNARSRRRP